jgi:hypothetical protein
MPISGRTRGLDAAIGPEGCVLTGKAGKSFRHQPLPSD